MDSAAPIPTAGSTLTSRHAERAGQPLEPSPYAVDVNSTFVERLARQAATRTAATLAEASALLAVMDD